MTDALKEVAAMEWFWNASEDGIFSGPFKTRDETIDDAVYGNAVFEDEEVKEIFLLNGRSYPNPDYQEDYPSDEENAPENISGKPVAFTKTMALEWALKEIDALKVKLNAIKVQL